MAFVSPYDLHFYRMLNIWNRLDKKYGDFQINFLIIVGPEQGLTFSEDNIRGILRDYNYSLPVYIDTGGNYSKSWRAYVNPTVNLIFKDGRVTNFDPGNFDTMMHGDH